MTALSSTARPAPFRLTAHRRLAAAARAALGGGAALVLGSLVLLSDAAAQQVNTLGNFRDWTAYTMTENGSPVCYIASKPTRDEGNYTRRGEIYALITHRPARQQFNVVTIYAGYTYQDGSSVDLSVGSRSFQMFTEGETAWATDEMDPRIVAAMKAGNNMVVKGTSSRGTSTRDTFSLLGVTAALNSINKACGVR